MAYEFELCGVWTPYKPDPWPVGWPEEAAFLKNEQGEDFYAWQRKRLAEDDKDVLYFTALKGELGFFVQAVQRDLSHVFPLNSLLVCVSGVDPMDTKPWKLFEQRYFNPVTFEFRDPPAPPVTRVSPAQATTALYKRGLLDRVEAIVANHPYPPVRLFYQRATFWEIDNPYVQAIALELDLDELQMQLLFNEAAKL